MASTSFRLARIRPGQYTYRGHTIHGLNKDWRKEGKPGWCLHNAEDQPLEWHPTLTAIQDTIDKLEDAKRFACPNSKPQPWFIVETHSKYVGKGSGFNHDVTRDVYFLSQDAAKRFKATLDESITCRYHIREIKPLTAWVSVFDERFNWDYICGLPLNALIEFDPNVEWGDDDVTPFVRQVMLEKGDQLQPYRWKLLDAEDDELTFPYVGQEFNVELVRA
jgi:hypothetical protein